MIVDFGTSDSQKSIVLSLKPSTIWIPPGRQSLRLARLSIGACTTFYKHTKLMHAFRHSSPLLQNLALRHQKNRIRDWSVVGGLQTPPVCRCSRCYSIAFPSHQAQNLVLWFIVEERVAWCQFTVAVKCQLIGRWISVWYSLERHRVPERQNLKMQTSRTRWTSPCLQQE